MKIKNYDSFIRTNRNMIIAVDFDGTIVDHHYPAIGTESRKLNADLWRDDRNLGGLPEWETIFLMIQHRLSFYDLILQHEEKDEYYSKPGCFKRLFRKIFILLCGVFCLMGSGCSSYREIPYLQDIASVNMSQDSLPLFDAKIKPKDLLTITVNTSDPEAATPFNLTIQSTSTSASRQTLTQQPTLQQYLVDNQGCINFPVLGKLHLGGLTKHEIESMIRERLKPYLREVPIVTVRMVNYKISVLGEVATPGTFTINNEKVNVLEALAMAGDMTIWGLRDNVKLVREKENGEKEIILLNLNQADIVNNPYYDLQQNDILYVSPNKTKAKNSDIGQSTSLWVSATSILVSIASLLVTVFK